MDAKLEKLVYRENLNEIDLSSLYKYLRPKPFLDMVVTSDSDKFDDLPENIQLTQDLSLKIDDFLRYSYEYQVEEFTDENGKTMYRHIFS
jgi:hypothetical protein